MNSLKYSVAITASLFLLLSASCVGGSNSNNKQIIRSMQPNVNTKYNQGDNIIFTFSSTSKIDSAQLFIDGEYVATSPEKGFSYPTSEKNRQGEHTYKIKAFRKGEDHEKSGRFLLLPKQETRRVTAKVASTLPHSRNSYTQGLEFYDNKLYESSGEYGKSYIKIMEFPSMKITKQVDLEAKYFGEGLTILNDKLYLLTWKEKKAFVYDAKTLELLDEHDYTTEGWGLTNDGEYLYMSDGTKYIYKIEPEEFKVVERIEVLSSEGAILDINELEWIDGKIWANVYGYDSILVIEPTTGLVESIIFCNNILSQSDRDETTDVFNGIAHDKRTNKIYVTGKNWPKMFEIEVPL